MFPSRLAALGLLVAVTAAADPPRTDLVGDPLPPGGVARIGSVRYRLAHSYHQVFLSPDGSTVIGNRDGQVVQLWDAATGKPVGDFQDPDLYEWSADLSPDGKLLALFGLDNRGKPAPDTTLRVYDLATRNPVWTSVIEEPNQNSRMVHFTPDGKRLVTAAQDVRVWYATTGDELARVPGQVYRLDVSADGTSIAFTSGRNLYVWDGTAKSAPRKVFEASRTSSDAVRFAPDGKTVYQSDYGRGLAGFDVATGKPAGDLAVGPVRWAAFSPDGKLLATGSVSTGGRLPREFGVTLWDATTGKLVRRLESGRAVAETGAWSRDGKRFAAISSGRLWVWDVATGELLGPDSAGHESHISALAFAPDRRLFTASDDGTVRAWDITTGKELLKLTMTHWVRGMDVSPDGTLVAANALGDDFRVWDAKTGQQVFKLLGHGPMGGLRRVRFSADEQTFLSLGDDGYLRSWEAVTGKLKAEHRLRLRDAPADDEPSGRAAEDWMFNRALDLGRDGTTFAIAVRTDLRVIAANTGKERMRLDAGPRAPDNLALSPDCKRLATLGFPQPPAGPGGAQVVVWDLEAGKPVVKFRTGRGSFRQVVAFTPDGKQVATDAASPPALQFWDAATGTATGVLDLPARPRAVAFDGGKLVAVALADGTVLVYDRSDAVKPPAKE
jgi:WD40 repeat protein